MQSHVFLRLLGRGHLGVEDPDIVARLADELAAQPHHEDPDTTFGGHDPGPDDGGPDDDGPDDDGPGDAPDGGPEPDPGPDDDGPDGASGPDDSAPTTPGRRSGPATRAGGARGR